jgi:hypothetical protein
VTVNTPEISEPHLEYRGHNMQTTQPIFSPLGLLLWVAVLFLIVKSPKRMQTLFRMVIAFLVTVLLFLVPGALLHRGDPEALGRISGLVALLVAVIVGWWHKISLKRSAQSPS